MAAIHILEMIIGMVFGDAESISGAKNSLIIHNKHPKAKMATNPDKNIKNMQNPLWTDLRSLMLL